MKFLMLAPSADRRDRKPATVRLAVLLALCALVTVGMHVLNREAWGMPAVNSLYSCLFWAASLALMFACFAVPAILALTLWEVAGIRSRAKKRSNGVAPASTDTKQVVQ